VNARPLGAAAIGAAGIFLLHAGAVPWPAATLGGLAAFVFALQRTIAGSISGYVLLALAAASVFLADHSGSVPARLLLALACLEIYGLVTIVAAARASVSSHRVSRRLLGAWLASSGAVLLGVALCAGTRAGAGSALVAGGLSYKLGVVPAFAWAPLLIRHTVSRIAALGVLAFVASFALLAWTMPRLPDPVAAATAVGVLSLATAPWALWHVVRQWRADRRCARSYGAVLAAACGLILLALTSRHLTFPAHPR
jgi:hypothetical protein